MDTSTRRPIWLGIVAATLAAPTGFFLYSIASIPVDEQFDLIGVLVAGLAIYYFGIIVSAPIAIAVALPYTL